MKGVACGAFFLLVTFFTILPGSLAGDAIDRGLSVRDGDILVSAGGTFELGFFSLGGPKKRYVGIWFKNVRVDNVVWVANSRSPLNDSTGVIKLGEDGNLVIQDKSGVTVWSSSSPAAAAAVVRRNPVAQLLESGNLVIRDGDGNRSDASSYLWQSFDEPGDTLVAGMRLSVNTKTGVTRHLTSWRAADDPSPGNYTLRLLADKLPHADLLRGSTVVYSSGAWDGSRFSGIQDVMSYEAFRFDVVSDGDEVYYSFEVPRGTYASLKLHLDGKIQRLVWNDRASTWNSFLSSSSDCGAFALCGPYAVCNISTSPICQCPRGFRPRSPRDWYLGDGSGGCVRAEELRCGGGDGFLLLQQVKLPETRNATVDMSVGVEECQERCASDCACTAYARADLRQGKAGCVTWTGDLVDVRTLGLQQLYVKVPASVLGDTTMEDAVKDERKPSAATVAVAIVAPVALLLVAACGGGIWMKKRSVTKREKTEDGDNRVHHSHVNAVGEAGNLPLLDFETIASATDNFSPGNKVGEGGFGVVYKGILDDGQEVAVKRLSWSSVQGVNEFMNEATLIAKLQHKNLVRLLGCCIRGEERMLIYEYMQNKSLDSFIFDKSKHALLDWRTRLDIILGVARGIMYLHHDSRFKIIHRDLKASNILLDTAMNPKISDFGTARIFGADQNVEKTKRVVGTYGYMSPEYAIHGTISVKSDVFSFGVLTLEILSGIKSQGAYENEPHMNLLSHAWKLWQEGNCLELVDAVVASSYDATQVTRCIQVALLCVQEHPIDRPTMSTVVMMLASENYPLPEPKRPGFYVPTGCSSIEISRSSKQEFTKIAITMTTIEAR